MEGLAEREKRLSLKEARYILSSRTKDSDTFRQIVHSLYLDHLKRHPGTAPQKDADEEKPKSGTLLDKVEKARADVAEIRKRIERILPQIMWADYRTSGPPPEPSLTVVQGGGKASKRRNRRPVLTVIPGRKV